jgi:hypothetical protein
MPGKKGNEKFRAVRKGVSEPSAPREIDVLRIPTGFRPKAQGCLALARKGEATLGWRSKKRQPQRGLRLILEFPMARPGRLDRGTTPLGTDASDSSPTGERKAHRFIGGNPSPPKNKSRQGRKKIINLSRVLIYAESSKPRSLSFAPSGAFGRFERGFPPINRWAIFGRPCGTCASVGIAVKSRREFGSSTGGWLPHKTRKSK